VMVHDPLPKAGLRLADPRPDCYYHTTGLMSSNHWLTTATNANGRAPSSGGTIRMQVTPAHAGGFHFEHHLAWPRRWLWELPQL